NHTYTCEVEIDRGASSVVDSDCDCPSKYDCLHQAAMLYHLEENLEELIVDFSKETGLDVETALPEQKKLVETIQEAKDLSTHKKGKKLKKELLEEYVSASNILGGNPFFTPEEKLVCNQAEIALLFEDKKQIEVQMALRVPFRSKLLYILNLKEFLEAVRYGEVLYIGGKRFFFNENSFDPEDAKLMKRIAAAVRFPEVKGEKNYRVGWIDPELFGGILAEAFHSASKHTKTIDPTGGSEDGFSPIPSIYIGNFETPLRYCTAPVGLKFELEYLISSSPKILLKPLIQLSDGKEIQPEEAHLFEGENPGLVYQNVYYRFPPEIKRAHLKSLYSFRDLIIPEPLFGTFVENALPELMRFAKVSNKELTERFATIPFTGTLEAECEIGYLEGEFEAKIHFLYEGIRVPLATNYQEADQVASFVTEKGILARNLTEEKKMVEDLFQDFIFDQSTGIFKAKTDKKIVEFMTETIPQFQHRVKFHCPENLLSRFVYDDTKFKLELKESDQVDSYLVSLEVKGPLEGLSVDQLWECLTSRRPYVEISTGKAPSKKAEGAKPHKILVLNLDQLAPVVRVLDEIGIKKLETKEKPHPLWNLAGISKEMFEGIPIQFSISCKLEEIQKQMLGLTHFDPKPIPKEVRAELRSYQVEGVHWLERLRAMHLNGVLADDMGLGKTLQTITSLTQFKQEKRGLPSLVVCPTSLLYNWKEEIHKFNPSLSTLIIDGTPQQRKKCIEKIGNYDLAVTSYSLIQKDVELLEKVPLGYLILDEAQAIKNRATRNAKSVKQLQAKHKLILSGTPIENSLEELWSLFDFLMPGLLGTYERFIEKYVRNIGNAQGSGLDSLRRKLGAFILRRMKSDVLNELPPVTEIVYHCHLTDVQKELYKSHAESAREELTKLVKKEGFEKVQIHVLATLTRLKQICCHPALFAKENADPGDSAKYERLLEMIETLMESKKRTVIFSQYTKMLQILRQDLEKKGVSFEYLDGSSKNRLDIVNRFNENADIPLFLVSLKAGGSGLNLVGADTVIHYDMWWNPAVENQATDRVHRLGQKNSVSSYKLVTLGTIEEKIVEMQNRKKELVRQVISCDEEAIGKLTWEEVLELLQV
ncbi:MAG: SNF2-related protein, partial [Parachlamydiaceae bacterium]